MAMGDLECEMREPWNEQKTPNPKRWNCGKSRKGGKHAVPKRRNCGKSPKLVKDQSITIKPPAVLGKRRAGKSEEKDKDKCKVQIL